MIKANSDLLQYLNLKLAALGQPISAGAHDAELIEIARPLLRNFEIRDQLLRDHQCPADARIQTFLNDYLREVRPHGAARLPERTLVLDRPGLARLLSLPADSDEFQSPYLRSYRVQQGVLHNPVSDRRTTKGVFHIVEGGYPVPADKQAVPTQTFAALLEAALTPPSKALAVPFTSGAQLFVSLLLRPVVCPATGRDPEKTMEIRFFAPGTLVSNLDFVETIFGNAGDPQLPENDAALDFQHWTGHTGCVILAPHLVGLKKAALGLPHVSTATDRQRRDGMCWESEDELYNSGGAFKICARDHRGVIVTIIADNYYGYCKKEVKTQISFAANLFGSCEEEHAGGALAFPTYVLGQDFLADRTIGLKKSTLECAAQVLGDLVEMRPEGYAADRTYDNVFYLPEDAAFSVRDGLVTWQYSGNKQQITLRPGHEYILPSGFRIRLEKQLSGTAWRLIGSRPHGTFCHKPCTVSGGGKSEISKSLTTALLRGPVFVKDYQRDMDGVAEIFKKDYSAIYKDRVPDARTQRPILSPDRSLGSVIQLMTPSPDYKDDYNEWLGKMSGTTRQLVFAIKRYYRPEWGDGWREHFTVDRVNGHLGHELKFDGVLLVANYLRVGYDADGSWRVYKLRPDFYPAEKVSREDDITASTILPRESLRDLGVNSPYPSVKLVTNCEAYLFQRPDDAIHPGIDWQAEADIATDDTFLSNYEPLTPAKARAISDRVVEFDRFTEPMKKRLENFILGDKGFVVSSAHPRLVNGKPSLNPRYLQRRPDLVSPRGSYLAEIAARIDRDIPAGQPVHFPVNAVLAGRRNNPPDAANGVPPLAVFGPIHYQELPELFMEFISSLTGKSPATTGFGSEGALTKGPFNALPPVADLNSALVGFILTGYAGFTTSAGCVGPNVRVDHDVSLLVPEVWCRMRDAERDPQTLIKNGFLEKIPDMQHVDGRTVQASRLGYRITSLFVDRYLGRMFETPHVVFPEEMLRPEQQNLELFLSGVDAIVETQRRVALNYFEDGSVSAACPPLRALLHFMAHGNHEGRDLNDPALRAMFTRESLLTSDWYRARLIAKQTTEIALWQRHLKAAADSSSAAAIRAELDRRISPEFLNELVGTTGGDPSLVQS